MQSPLGPLAGTQDESLGKLLTYGDFTFSGVHCMVSGERGWVDIAPGQQSDSYRCRPENVDFMFSAPIPLATLKAMQWKPMPVTSAQLARLWHNYPHWFLRPRDTSQDADG